ncbi:hypothetical protein [Limnohabitans sp.]|uniref:hypothetical protein n=1 Tax=Limnohabitans sp. TaxID=1907725 RepID=UPI00333ED01D
MATISLGFNLSASSVQMASGINAGVVELQKLGYAAKKTSQDVAVLKTIELSRAFLSTVRAAAGAFSQFIGGTAGAVASIDDLAKRTGVSADVLQGYSLAANQSGVSLETFGKAVQKLTINLGEAQTGNAAAVKSFADLGLSVRDLSRLSPQEAFEAVAAAIAKLPNPAQQAAAAVSLFGKSGVELTPIFQEGATYLQQMVAEAKRLGISLSPQQIAGITALDDSLEKTRLTLQGFSQRLLAELAPALTQAAERATEFITSIDVRTVAAAATQAIQDLGSVFQILANAAAPLAGNILPLIGGYLAFINRQVIGSGIAVLGRVFVSAAAAAFGYAGAAGAAATATAGLAVAIRGLLASTGLGLLVVALGLVAGAALEWALASDTAGTEVAASVEDPKRAMDEYNRRMRLAISNTEEFGTKAKEALKVPGFTAQDLAQEAIDEANAAVKSLAKELGGLNQVPTELLEKFRNLKGFAGELTADSISFEQGLQLASNQAQTLTQEVRTLIEARKRDADAVKQSAEAAKKSAQEARSRTAELAVAGLSDAEKSRLQLNQDLLAIGQEQRAAEEALAAAKRASDAKGIADAKERLRLAQEAAKAAKDQGRERQLQALGINESLLRPATTLADQFKAVREAFDKKLIDGGEARQALRNLATEGIEIRKQIARELSRPAQAALEVSDVRTSQGMSRFMSLATGREDPAIEQMRQQLGKLEEIRRELQRVGANPVDILGA